MGKRNIEKRIDFAVMVKLVNLKKKYIRKGSEVQYSPFIIKFVTR